MNENFTRDDLISVLYKSFSIPKVTGIINSNLLFSYQQQ